MTTQAWELPFYPIPLMALCGFRLARSGYAQPQLLYIPLAFSYLISTTGLKSNEKQSFIKAPFFFVFYVLAVIWPKVQEFMLKLNFIFVYIAPWQISWGSAFHAFAQPFSVPHSGLICAQAAISSLFSAPLNPFLGILFYLIIVFRLFIFSYVLYSSD